MNSLASTRLYSHLTFYEAFLRDLRHADECVLIESPFITIKRVNELLPVITKLRRRGVRVIVNTRHPDEHDVDYAKQARISIHGLQCIGVKVLYTVKHHRKLAVIDGKLLWEGSLNILSQNDSCEIMRRTESRELSDELLSFIGTTSWLN